MPEENEKPKIHQHSEIINHGSNLRITFKGEQYKGMPVLDTKVEIEGGTLCYITWEEKENFFTELQALIDRYAI